MGAGGTRGGVGVGGRWLVCWVAVCLVCDHVLVGGGFLAAFLCSVLEKFRIKTIPRTWMFHAPFIIIVNVSICIVFFSFLRM